MKALGSTMNPGGGVGMLCFWWGGRATFFDRRFGTWEGHKKRILSETHTAQQPISGMEQRGDWSWRTIAGRRESRKKAAKHTKNPWAARANPDEVISWPFNYSNCLLSIDRDNFKHMYIQVDYSSLTLESVSLPSMPVLQNSYSPGVESLGEISGCRPSWGRITVRWDGSE